MLMMSMDRYQASGWIPPIIEAVATEDRGVDQLYEAILQHREHLVAHDHERLRSVERSRVRNQLLDVLKENLMDAALKRLGGIEALDGVVEEIVARTRDPYGVGLELVEKLLAGSRG
jgi:LAO/AO transport system kinase